MKKPSEFCAMENHGYLGHFKNAEVLAAGHNTSEKEIVEDASEKRRSDYMKKLAKESGLPRRAKFFEELGKAFEKKRDE